MREDHGGKITDGELHQLSRGAMEQVVDIRSMNGVGAESHDHLDSAEENYSSGGQGDVRPNPRSTYRTAQEQASDLVSMSNETHQVADDKCTRQSMIETASRDDDASQQTMEKWALDNAPPPIKVRREGETSEESSPQELSPPPSPKRMRELVRKDPVHDLAFRKIFTQDSM